MPGAKAEVASTSDEQANGHASSDIPRETVEVTVTDVTSGQRFYVQVRYPKACTSLCELIMLVVEHALWDAIC